jgi:cyclic pyranopterin phosphate synthase
MSPYDISSPEARTPAAPAGLTDGFGRRIGYVRISVTDRCDLRCVYCMAEHMTFLPKAEVLSIAELDRVASLFVRLGTRKLRLTGGEPLVRKGFMELVERLSRHLKTGALDELTLTTNATRLQHHAAELARLGVKRINVSLDTLDPGTFGRLTRGGNLDDVLAGIDAALAAGLKLKINAVALARDNHAEIPGLMRFAHARGMDLVLIETMPLGEIDEDRTDQYLSLRQVKAELASVWTLTPLPDTTGGPARYSRVAETGGRIGFITPMSHTFCDSCNRVRVTCTGTLHTCLGHEDATDLRALLRAVPGDDAAVEAAIRAAVTAKPLAHDFHIGPGQAPAVRRHMSTTGG